MAPHPSRNCPGALWRSAGRGCCWCWRWVCGCSILPKRKPLNWRNPIYPQTPPPRLPPPEALGIDPPEDDPLTGDAAEDVESSLGVTDAAQNQGSAETPEAPDVDGATSGGSSPEIERQAQSAGAAGGLCALCGRLHPKRRATCPMCNPRQNLLGLPPCRPCAGRRRRKWRNSRQKRKMPLRLNQACRRARSCWTSTLPKAARPSCRLRAPKASRQSRPQNPPQSRPRNRKLRPPRFWMKAMWWSMSPKARRQACRPTARRGLHPTKPPPAETTPEDDAPEDQSSLPPPPGGVALTMLSPQARPAEIVAQAEDLSNQFCQRDTASGGGIAAPVGAAQWL